ncbi:hypothetical protein [Streptomyces malaysiensis]|uniref:Uncharacterized protein n=1 Tax=Streptomyces malaysiensis subsp. samsunensis TaxID=459658 RepID=A0A9X2LVL0_STRMQ|nr:hypothetical protein [Streptomyces samsunensis]MCQ8828919.1 hypothetical protein [Streptomyces samsunensis]
MSGSALNAGIALGPLAAAPFVPNSSAGLFTAVAVLFAAITEGTPPGVGRGPAGHVVARLRW